MSTIVKTKNSNNFSRAPQDSIILYRPDSSTGEPSSIFYKDRDSSVYKYSGSNCFVKQVILDSTDPTAPKPASEVVSTVGAITAYGIPDNSKSSEGDLFVYIENDTGTDTTTYTVFLKVGDRTGGTWLQLYSSNTPKVITGNAELIPFDPGAGGRT